MYQFDQVVQEFSRIGVVGVCTGAGVSTRVARIRASATAAGVESTVLDMGCYHGHIDPTGVDVVIVMLPPAGVVPPMLFEMLSASGVPFIQESYTDHPSYTQEHEAYLASSADLLLELEKLLPADNPVRVQREQYRAQCQPIAVPP